MRGFQSAVPAPLRIVLYVATAALLTTILSRAQAIVVPVALAIMGAFVLSPPVLALERKGLHRIASVGVVLTVALGLVGAFGYLLAHEFSDFATQMPQYAVSIKAKLETLHQTRKGALGKIEETVNEVSHELVRQDVSAHSVTTDVVGVPAHAVVQPVSIVPTQPNDIETLRLILGPTLTSVATAGIVLILSTFMLMGREDLRNRLIRLVGSGRMTVTTRMLDEAGHRISGFLFTQSVINGAFGICIGLGLLLIDVPYALLWGVTAALLRFVPYLGSLLALLMPAALAFVGSPGWGPAVETVVLFLGLDAATAYAVEPIMIGTNTGVSSLALLISAMFWAWLWGPVGLVLSTPLTVCLTAVGKHVPGMEFLAVLLGDEPPLEPHVTLYQRLLAGDEEEATEILEHELNQADRAGVFDRVVVPTLIRARRDQLRGEISPGEEQLVLNEVLAIVRHSIEADGQDCPEPRAQQRKMLAVPARTLTDEIAVEMLSQLLGRAWTLDRLTTATLASEVLAEIERRAPDVLCIAALPPGGFGHIRYLCKRVHTENPNLPIWVLRTDVGADPLKTVSQLINDGAQQVATSFAGVPVQLSRLVFAPAHDGTSGGAALTAPNRKKTEAGASRGHIFASR
jgi:predicted PurR-regulated permease PerM